MREYQQRRPRGSSDPDGRLVVLLERIWEQKIVLDHPELRDHIEDVLGTVAVLLALEAEYPEPRSLQAVYAGSIPAGSLARAEVAWAACSPRPP
ncbi:MAG: hypothetical protein ACREGK_02395 [Geminicoccales bacterium]